MMEDKIDLPIDHYIRCVSNDIDFRSVNDKCIGDIIFVFDSLCFFPFCKNRAAHLIIM